MQNQPHQPDCDNPRCRCCDELIEGTAFCRTCYDRANYQPDAGEINAALLEACREAEYNLEVAIRTGHPALRANVALANVRAAIAQATAHTPAAP